MERNEILKLIQNGEGQKLDFKETISSKQKIARTIVSFANSEGGKLLIGIKDNKTIVGIDAESEKYMIDSAIKDFCKPMIVYEFEDIEIENKTILIVNIHKSIKNIFYALDDNEKWISYIRIGDQSMKTSYLWVNAMKRRYSNNERAISLNSTDKLIIEKIADKQHDLEEIIILTNLNKWKISRSLIKLVGLGILEIIFESGVEKIRQKMLTNL
jgi:predicted HTH transcriptional regulator